VFCLCGEAALNGATYTLSSGEAINAAPFHFDQNGVVFRYPDGRVSPRVAWTNFTEASLKDFAQDPKARSFVSGFLESPEDDVRVRKEITVKAPPRLDRPTRQSAVGALFASPLSIALIALVFLANLYGAYEIAIYRRYPLGIVIGAAAILPFAAPIVFLCLPTRTDEAPQEAAAAPPAPEPPQRAIPSAPPPRPAAGYTPPARFSTPGQAQQPVPAANEEHQPTEPTEEAPAEEPPPPAAPKLPQPIVYRRGQTMFNRRFFETKLTGFLRMIPSDAEKDLVINVKSARGEYVGNRISKLQPEELTLQYHRGSASSDVTIPFTEIQEVTVRHKDA
jgi:outer membrane biosynthesis protein TonB